MNVKKNFITFLEDSKKYNINNTYNKYFEKLLVPSANAFEMLPDFLLYGPAGCGKYTEALKIIEKFSPSNLKYEKKLYISNTKTEHIIKISDIHYEINMENLTCNSKILFNNIYNNIIDSINSTVNKYGIILCKNFHTVDEELLEIFYSYMQKIINCKFVVKFIILTESISFIPSNILQKSKILYYSKLSNTNYIKLANKSNKKLFNNLYINNYPEFKSLINDVNNINIIKIQDINVNNYKSIDLNKSICNKLVYIILLPEINYIELRNRIYDILIYNLNIYECVFYILKKIILDRESRYYSSSFSSSSSSNFNNTFINSIYLKTCDFFKLYNNNYRPIFHLESYFIYIIKILRQHDNEQ